MIKLDLDKPIPYICELKKGCTDDQLNEALKLLKIDPTCDSDLRLWFAIQFALVSISKEGGKERKDKMTPEHYDKICNRHKYMTYGELLKKGRGVILKNYWVDRRDWNLESLVGGFKKLNHTDGDLGLSLLKKNWEPKSNNCVIRSCSSSKPYIESPRVKDTINYLKPWKKDLMVASYCPVPLECSFQYPFAFYQGTMWDAVEPPSNWMPHNVKNFFDYFNYDKILVWTKPKQIPTMKSELEGKPAYFFEKSYDKPNGIVSAYYYNITHKDFEKFAGQHLEKIEDSCFLF